MTIRRGLPLAIAAVSTVVVACTAATDVTSVPYGFVTVVAQTAGAGYTASPVASFFDARGLGAPGAVSAWDSCRVQPYSPGAVLSFGDVYPSIGAGSAVAVKFGARTDSLFPVAVGREIQYKLRTPTSIPYTPGDSVSVVVPGNSDGYPAISFRAKTAEAVAVTNFGTPNGASRLDLRWNAAQDLNATMTVSFRFGASGADSLNTQIYCQFKDDGADSIPARYMASWAQAPTRSWTAQRVRSYVASVAKGGYFNFISTFDVPTPASP